MKRRETFSVLVFVAMALALSLHALRVTSNEVILEQFPSNAIQEIVITIEGAIAEPGRYHFKKGVKIREVLGSVQLLDDADISRLNLDQSIKKGRKLKIPKRKVRTKKGPSHNAAKKNKESRDKSC